MIFLGSRFFCGSGTMFAVAEKIGTEKWIGSGLWGKVLVYISIVND